MSGCFTHHVCYPSDPSDPGLPNARAEQAVLHNDVRLQGLPPATTAAPSLGVLHLAPNAYRYMAEASDMVKIWLFLEDPNVSVAGTLCQSSMGTENPIQLGKIRWIRIELRCSHITKPAIPSKPRGGGFLATVLSW